MIGLKLNYIDLCVAIACQYWLESAYFSAIREKLNVEANRKKKTSESLITRLKKMLSQIAKLYVFYIKIQ